MKYVCELCGMVYDEAAGDPKRGIPAGTAFSQLPGGYDCPGCGSGLEAFSPAGRKNRLTPQTPDRAFWNNAKYSDGTGESER